MAITSTSFFKVDIKRRGTPPELMMKKIRVASQNISTDLELLAVRVSRKMAQIIDANRRRKGARTRANTGLAGYFRKGTGINVSRSGIHVAVSIGNKTELTAFFPYWRIINKGGKAPPANLGFFGHFQRPERNKRGEVWHGGAIGGSPWIHKYYIQPKKLIPAMNYIGKTNAWLRVYWRAQQKKILSKLK